MAGGKKAAKKLTPEEWLEQALVPVGEQPYAVPENWCWTRIKNVAVILNGYAFMSQNYVDKGIRIIRITNVQDGYIEDDKPVFYPFENEVEMKKYMLEAGDLLISLTGNVGRVAFLNNEMLPAALNQRVGCLRFNHSFVNKSFLFYYFLRQEFQDSCIKNSKGSAQLNMSTEWLKSQPVPIPPFNEQQRIAECIESLFAKLDEAREKAQAVLDSFELRRSAVLYKAFSGELTEQWRIKNNMSFSGWKQIKFGELGLLERGRSKHRPRNDPKLFGGKYPFIQTGDVARSGMYIVEHSQTLNEEGMRQSRIFPKGTLCITIAANIGDVSILTYDCCFPDSVVGFTPNALTSSKFIYYMMSTIQRKLEADAPATAQKNINLKILNEITIKVPLLDEQDEIINILERVFEKEQQTKNIAETVINQIDIMKKSILSRAFRGELGTNNPDDENAAELLKKIVTMK